jgi:hypothetical protein
MQCRTHAAQNPSTLRGTTALESGYKTLVRSSHRVGPARRSRAQNDVGGDDGGDDDLDIVSRAGSSAEADAASIRAAARDSSKSCAAVL